MVANHGYPLPRMLLAGLVQGSMSACLTLFLKTAIDRLSARLPARSTLWAPPLVACMVSSAMLATIHAVSGTPEILKTIALPLAVSTSYAALYNYSLYRRRERA